MHSKCFFNTAYFKCFTDLQLRGWGFITESPCCCTLKSILCAPRARLPPAALSRGHSVWQACHWKTGILLVLNLGSRTGPPPFMVLTSFPILLGHAGMPLQALFLLCFRWRQTSPLLSRKKILASLTLSWPLLLWRIRTTYSSG